MRTRSQSRRRRQQQTLPVVENFELEDPIVEQNVVPMADIEQWPKWLQAPPSEGTVEGRVGFSQGTSIDQSHMGRTLFQKFINQYFPPSKTTYYRNEIITFYQKTKQKAFNEAWERFDAPLVNVSTWAFSELHQLDTFYNSLNSNDQDALDSAAGGNFLDKMPQEGLAIIESTVKSRSLRSRANVSRVEYGCSLYNSSTFPIIISICNK
ncbi:hypothetical protein Tco_0353092 [Tanacetum coccineum]